MKALPSVFVVGTLGDSKLAKVKQARIISRFLTFIRVRVGPWLSHFLWKAEALKESLEPVYKSSVFSMTKLLVKIYDRYL